MKFVVEAIGLKSGGGLELALNLLSNFRHHGEHEFVVLIPDLPQYDGVVENAWRVVRYPPNASLMTRNFTLNREVPHICRSESADALLCLGNFAPKIETCPTVVLLHNPRIVYDTPAREDRLTLRERLTVAYGKRFYRQLPRHVRVIVQTSVMRERLARGFGLDRNRIDVIPSSTPECGQSGNSTRRRHAIPQDRFTFLCISRYYPHKNLEVLVQSASVLRSQSRAPFRCLLTLSPEEHPGARKLLSRIKKEGLEDVLVNIGPVPHTRISEVYARADAFLLPTLLETFSFTYNEAMHFGLPILTSDRDFARDRCRDAAAYFDPLDAGSVAHAMAMIMENEQLRMHLVAKGKRLLQEAPGWEEIAGQFVAALERAAGGQKPVTESACVLSV